MVLTVEDVNLPLLPDPTGLPNLSNMRQLALHAWSLSYSKDISSERTFLHAGVLRRRETESFTNHSLSLGF